MAKETYANARIRLLKEFFMLGYEVKPNLKIPQVIGSNNILHQKETLFFHKQAVYLGAHSLHIDIRGMSPGEIMSAVNERLARRVTDV